VNLGQLKPVKKQRSVVDVGSVTDFGTIRLYSR
jgi:hypothetical protein